MSRWFRHYAGMARDDKLVRAALRAKQPVERVVWLWSVILESAAEIDDGGRFELDVAEVAYFLRADEADIGSVVDALEYGGRISQGAVVKWGDRQFQSDRSAERQRRLRERRKTERHGGDERAETEDDRHHDQLVTSPSRHGDAPETETEADTEIEHRSNDISVAPRAIEPPRPTDAEAEALIEAADRAISEHFPGRRRRRHANDLAIARGWAERRIGPDRIAAIVSAQVERHRVLKPDDMPSSLRFFEAEVDRAEPPPQYPLGIASDDDRQWYDLVVAWKVKGVWITRRGAKPDDPATMVPDHVLAAHGLTRRKVRAA